ncbi:hypothetical protein AMECASPLE_010277 [Ameca splendens]|uniref:Uncharacterized protein n=1 Tax=Ameca splendens TaxID=208324 RepID=A0ABV0ZKH8_9TELE
METVFRNVWLRNKMPPPKKRLKRQQDFVFFKTDVNEQQCSSTNTEKVEDGARLKDGALSQDGIMNSLLDSEADFHEADLYCFF